MQLSSRFDHQTEELEILASSGLSMKYLNKGPLLTGKSIRATLKREPVIIRDVKKTDRLQYPDDAENEGIGAIISVPIIFNHNAVGALRLYHHQAWDISELTCKKSNNKMDLLKPGLQN